MDNTLSFLPLNCQFGLSSFFSFTTGDNDGIISYVEFHGFLTSVLNRTPVGNLLSLMLFFHTGFFLPPSPLQVFFVVHRVFHRFPLSLLLFNLLV